MYGLGNRQIGGIAASVDAQTVMRQNKVGKSSPLPCARSIVGSGDTHFTSRIFRCKGIKQVTSHLKKRRDPKFISGRSPLILSQTNTSSSLMLSSWSFWCCWMSPQLLWLEFPQELPKQPCSSAPQDPVQQAHHARHDQRSLRPHLLLLPRCARAIVGRVWLQSSRLR
jgi:hypothetical protein